MSKKYEPEKKYFNSSDWGIIPQDGEDHRSEGLTFLQDYEFTTANYVFYDAYQFINNVKEINEMLCNTKSGYITIFEPVSPEAKRCSIPGNTIDVKQIVNYIKDNKMDLTKYHVCFAERILSVFNSFCGTAISDGKGNIVIEILLNSDNLIDLTSSGVDRTQTQFFRFYDFEEKVIGAKFIKKIKKDCQFFKGYYEFIYGQVNGVIDVYYTSYSKNKKYLNILDQQIAENNPVSKL